MIEGLSPENLEILEEYYRDWQDNRDSVPESWRDYFETLSNTPAAGSTVAAGEAGAAGTGPAEGRDDHARKQSRVDSLIWAYRDVGYLYAKINPLHGYMPKELQYMYFSISGMYENLSLEAFGLAEDDLETVFDSSKHLNHARAPLREIIDSLQETYCSHIGVEFLHIQNKSIRKWLIQKIENGHNSPDLEDDQKIKIQKDLIRALEFENFLHSHFVGQKRFSVEGAEVIIPALHRLVDISASWGVEEIVLGMSHRGRLNALVNIFGKPMEQIFAKFQDNDESPTYGASGDVRYHLGYSRDHVHKDGTKVHLSLVANPSHLESVDPVVQGKTRATQVKRKDLNRKKVLPVLLHGDAAFSGQGVVGETFNLSKLRGYETGGTVHIIVNNQIGFTTSSRDQRSTFFATDNAKLLPIPIFHVNGDRPEHVMHAVDLAFSFRQKFGYDAIVDIFCYRKYGHNEADDPSFTHPIMYEMISKSPGVTRLYGEYLSEKGIFSGEEQEQYIEEYHASLEKDLDTAKEQQQSGVADGYLEGEWKGFQRGYSFDRVDTSVEKEKLDSILSVCTTVPDNFSIHSKLNRVISKRKEMLDGEGAVDWATAEALCFGSLLLEGYPIRLSGEDSGRGTFSQRHSVWWNIDSKEPDYYIPLNNLGPKQAVFTVYDSPLSEFSVLGFEFGYSLNLPNSLVIWEAQFGDFCNGAQVIIDQFLAGSEAKWDRSSGLVLLLPHGYEGQGPEHSSAFLERFLQLCAEDNMQVCNPTTPAQYFHLLRRQMIRDFRKPLVIMTPKSLLRHKSAVSTGGEFTRDGFSEVLDDPEMKSKPGTAERLILCSGKIYYELTEGRREHGNEQTALIRMEQFHPFPKNQLSTILASYPNAKELSWVQEETRNRGGWTFMHERLGGMTDLPLRYIGRPPGASPASGSYSRFRKEQESIVSEAFSAGS